MRGFIYTLEAVIAGIVIISFLAFLAYEPPTVIDEGLNLKSYEILEGLDNQGLLRSYVVDENVSGLNSQITFFSANHTVQICNVNGACNGTIPNGSNVFTGTYIIAGDNDYNPHYVKLYLWRG